MEICPLSCQQSLGSPPDQLAARGEHGSLAPGMFSSPNSRAGSRDGGSQLGDHVVLCPPAGGKERGQAALPFGSSAAGFSSQTEPQRNVRTLKGSGRLHVPLLCCPSTPPFISMPFAPPLPFSSLHIAWVTKCLAEGPSGFLAGADLSRFPAGQRKLSLVSESGSLKSRSLSSRTALA